MYPAWSVHTGELMVEENPADVLDSGGLEGWRAGEKGCWGTGGLVGSSEDWEDGGLVGWGLAP